MSNLHWLSEPHNSQVYIWNFVNTMKASHRMMMPTIPKKWTIKVSKPLNNIKVLLLNINCIINVSKPWATKFIHSAITNVINTFTYFEELRLSKNVITHKRGKWSHHCCNHPWKESWKSLHWANSDPILLLEIQTHR